MTIAGISVGELAEIGGVVAAVCAVVLGPLLGHVRRHQKQIRQLEVRAVRVERVGGLACQSFIRGLVGIDNTLDWSCGIIHRMLLHREEEVDMMAAVEELRLLRLAVERSSAEVRLLAGAPAEQVSALQHLTFRLGDLDTAAALNEVANLEGIPGLSEATLRDAHTALTQRLMHPGRIDGLGR